jgi:uncharacterized repeat protein (TIGR02543 family)
VKRISIFLILVALIAGMVGCLPVQYTLTITSTVGGNVTTPGVGNFTYNNGTVVKIVATPGADYSFVNWTGNVGTIANVTAASTNITISGNYSITANFAQLPTQYSLSMKVAPAGSGTASDMTNASPYTAGTVVNIRAVAAAGNRFVSWSAPAGTFGSATAGNTTFTMPSQNVTVTANFMAVYNLTMAVYPGGSGYATDLTNASPYTVDTVVNIRAAAAAGYRFVSWSAPAGTFGNATSGNTTFTMPAQYVTVTANFVAVYNLTMAVAPGGSGNATDLTNASPYAAGASVSISAVPNQGYVFANWTAPAGTFGSATAKNTTFTMPAQNITVTANFVAVYNLTMAVAPGGSGNATDLTNASPYAAGTSVSISAVPNQGYVFANWTAPAGAFGSATAENTTFTMPAQNVTVTANFVAVYNLTMAVAPGGSGNATDLTNASPYAAGASVSISAVPNQGYMFANWTAPAGAFGSATAENTNFTMPAQNITVTANFVAV